MAVNDRPTAASNYFTIYHSKFFSHVDVSNNYSTYYFLLYFLIWIIVFDLGLLQFLFVLNRSCVSYF